MQTPFPGARMTAKPIGVRLPTAGDGHCLHLQTQFGEDRCMRFPVVMVTNPPTHTHPHTDRTDYNTLVLVCSVTRRLKMATVNLEQDVMSIYAGIFLHVFIVNHLYRVSLCCCILLYVNMCSLCWFNCQYLPRDWLERLLL